MHYDEDESLTNYVLKHYAHLMTPLESRVMRAIQAEEKARVVQSKEMESSIRTRWGRTPDEEVAQALEAGAGPFRRGVRERLFRERSADIAINRCPACQRIVRTPSARQCLWCGYDWH
ncbi:MAG TPA: hypothetical protein VGZ22_29340 [Isosphaeraceae bacterium]|jgi:hypothetical protein|nr:hypothetical protein [Isosphaeraceae bacterium]